MNLTESIVEAAVRGCFLEPFDTWGFTFFKPLGDWRLLARTS